MSVDFPIISSHPPRSVQCDFCQRQALYDVFDIGWDHAVDSLNYVAHLFRNDLYRQNRVRSSVLDVGSVERAYRLPYGWLHIEDEHKDNRYLCPACVLKTVKERLAVAEEQQ